MCTNTTVIMFSFFEGIFSMATCRSLDLFRCALIMDYCYTSPFELEPTLVA